MKVQTNNDIRNYADNVNTLTVSVPKSSYQQFFKTDLITILTEIKRVSRGGTWIPTEISESVTMPNEEFMMTLRDSKFVKHIPLPTWFDSCRGDVATYCRKLVTQTIRFNRNERDGEKVSQELGNQLISLNAEHSLNLIGGIQTSDSTFECLFFKEDRMRPEPVKLFMHYMFCEQWGDSVEQTTQVQDNIRDIQLEENGILRCVLGMRAPGTQKTGHICVFEIIDSDRDYTVKNWPEAMQERLEIDIDDKKLTKLNYDAEIT